MSTLSSRQISISDHHRRRRSSGIGTASGSGSGSTGSNSSSSSSNNKRGRHLADSQITTAAAAAVASATPTVTQTSKTTTTTKTTTAAYNSEGGYDSHAASYGNYDAPSRYSKSYGASGDHGCYAAESYIGYASSSSDNSKSRKATPGVVHQHQHRYSNPLIDLEGQRSAMVNNSNNNSRQRRSSTRRNQDDHALRLSQASTVPMGSRTTTSSQSMMEVPQEECSWEEESMYSYGDATTATASTSNTITSRSSNVSTNTTRSLAQHEDAIRQGIVDISTLIATYVAGALSFIIGIFLTLVSPFVKVIKLIVGDVRGLLGDAAFLQEVGSLWRMYRDLRRRGGRSAGDDDDGGYRHHNHHHGGRYYQDDESTGDNSTVYTENSSQFVGGWRPSVNSVGSRGSNMSAGTTSAGTTRGSTRSTTSSSRGAGGAGVSTASRSYSSLPLVYEDQYQDQEVVPQVSSSPGKEALTTCPPNNMMYQEQQRGQHHHHHSPNGYYTNNGYPSSSQQQQHLPRTARQSSPQKQRGVGIPQTRRSRSSVV